MAEAVRDGQHHPRACSLPRLVLDPQTSFRACRAAADRWRGRWMKRTRTEWISQCRRCCSLRVDSPGGVHRRRGPRRPWSSVSAGRVGLSSVIEHKLPAQPLPGDPWRRRAVPEFEGLAAAFHVPPCRPPGWIKAADPRLRHLPFRQRHPLAVVGLGLIYVAVFNAATWLALPGACLTRWRASYAYWRR